MITLEEALNEYEYFQDENEKAKIVFAYFGEAVFYAQVFEQHLINMLALPEVANGKVKSGQEIDDLWNSFEKDKKTFGKLISDLKRKYILPNHILQKLTDSLEERNYIIHTYFKKNDRIFFSTEGQRRVIKDMVMFVHSLKNLELDLEPYIEAYENKINISKDLINSELAKMKEEGKIFDFSKYVSMKK